jgi:hypothetical protein
MTCSAGSRNPSEELPMERPLSGVVGAWKWHWHSFRDVFRDVFPDR